MSDYAATELGGNALSAWEYRSLYLRDGTKFEKFYCPFCDIPLCDRLIYTEGELSKSPHFAAVWENHKFGCDGEPLTEDQQRKRPSAAHYATRKMHIPEVLVDRPAPRTVSTALYLTGKPLTQSDVLERRHKAGLAGMAQPRSYLLQPIVEARNAIVSEGFERAKKEGWTNEERNGWLKRALSRLPLTLDQKTNYDDAFRTPAFIHWNKRRIYHGSGQVIGTSNCFTFQSDIPARLRDAGDTLFRIWIDMTGLLGPGSPRSHAVLAKKLEDLASSATRAKWYAYGVPHMADDGTCRLALESIDYLYFKPHQPKRN